MKQPNASASPPLRRVLRALHIVLGIATALGVLAVLVDATILGVFYVSQAHNAWYFPFSLLVLPVLIPIGLGFALTRWALRRR